MAKKQSNVSRRAWNILRLALLWARKGGVFKRRLVMDLRLVPKFIKSMAPASSSSSSGARIGFYGERELSFDKTPLFQVKMHRPASMRFIIPCITPHQADFDYNDVDDDENNVFYGEGRPCTSGRRISSCIDGNDGDIVVVDDEEDDYEEQYSDEECSVVEEEEAEGIDSRADKFIAQFYEQMKLQRQVSYLEYHKN
ncbi:unnamed protein product [Linum tenue]|uniref:Cotton fiber protein n=1 Tax=Linum tenue TaxID=586396 RepID=A0AAV0PFX7_9ROSI|nr:unnamed protein product [Linum tenue]